MLKLLTTTWDWKPSVILGCAAFLIYYYVLARKFRANKWQLTSFTGGTLVFMLALISPLDTIGDTYLFSVHMLQHLLLLLAVPPFWLWGIPPRLLKRLRSATIVVKVERLITHPVVAWLVGVGTVWLWHVPILYEATLHNETVHVVEHLTFVASGVIFFWPVMIAAPSGTKQFNPLLAMLYLFGAAISSTLLGIILTYAQPSLYPSYLHPADRYGLLPLLREQWQFTPQVDIQTGGIMMWVLGSPIYLIGCLGMLGRWYKQSELETAQEIAAQLEAERVANAQTMTDASFENEQDTHLADLPRVAAVSTKEGL